MQVTIDNAYNVCFVTSTYTASMTSDRCLVSRCSPLLIAVIRAGLMLLTGNLYGTGNRPHTAVDTEYCGWAMTTLLFGADASSGCVLVPVCATTDWISGRPQWVGKAANWAETVGSDSGELESMLPGLKYTAGCVFSDGSPRNCSSWCTELATSVYNIHGGIITMDISLVR